MEGRIRKPRATTTAMKITTSMAVDRDRWQQEAEDDDDDGFGGEFG